MIRKGASKIRHSLKAEVNVLLSVVEVRIAFETQNQSTRIHVNSHTASEAASFEIR
jgi:hypothetical protein